MGSLTIEISRGKVGGCVQKLAAAIENHRRSHASLAWLYDGRTTSCGRSCVIVSDRGTLRDRSRARQVGAALRLVLELVVTFKARSHMTIGMTTGRQTYANYLAAHWLTVAMELYQWS